MTYKMAKARAFLETLGMNPDLEAGLLYEAEKLITSVAVDCSEIPNRMRSEGESDLRCVRDRIRYLPDLDPDADD